MGNKYVREIDGLRAIAVLAVVAYHAGLPLPAGFVGVDVFFVISGYLITSLLLKEHEDTGGIDLVGFYARRVRRIFPAAAVVVLATLAASTLLLSLDASNAVARSAGAALVFGANVFFQFMTGGYWDAASEEMPLLHLWSLSVEEQFYFLWPALLLFTRSRKAMLALALASFGLAEWWLQQGSNAAFYQMPARFWELAVGGLIASLPAKPWPRWSAAAGIAMTLAACFVPIGHFPGYGAMPAVLGAALVIGAMHGGATNRLLASSPMVGVGLISYSLYLWHWPLLALYRATTVEQTLQTKLLLCGVAFALAIASYRYIEQPFRRLRTPKGRTVAIGASLSLVLAGCASALAMRVDPSPTDNPLALNVAADIPDRRCHSTVMEIDAPKCHKGSARTAVWGDSMAFAWSPMSDVSFSRDACGPFLGYMPKKVMPADSKCLVYTENVAAEVAGLDTLYLVARWQHADDRIPYLPATLARVAPKVKRIVILGPTPSMKDAVPDCIRHGLEQCAVSRAGFDAEAQPILRDLREAASRYSNVEVLDLTDRFCTPVECPPIKDGIALYWDSHHVSATAARKLAR